MDHLNQICDIIILISAVIIAGKNIYNFLKKPVQTVQERMHEEEERRVKEILETKLPECMDKFSGTVDEIKTSLEHQGITMDNMSKILTLLREAELDTMRYNMNRIYYKYRPYQKMLSYDKQAFLKFYNDYHEMGGNTWIDSIYDEAKDWPDVGSERELKN